MRDRQAQPERSRPRWAWRAATSAAVIGVAVLLVTGPYEFIIAGLTGSTEEGVRDAPCLPGDPVAILDSPHIPQSGAADVEYNSVPPTSGPHFAFAAAPGVYQEPLPDGLTVHSLEHGYIVIQYAPDLPQQQVTALAKLARRYGADVVLAPYPPLAEGIALTAWGRIDLLERYDERRITGFVEALRGRYQHGWTVRKDCPDL